LNRCVSAFFLLLRIFSLFRSHISLLSVLSIRHARVKIEASVTMSWLGFGFFIFVRLRLESCIFVLFQLCLNLLKMQFFLLLPNLIFFVKLGHNITIAKLPKLFFSLLFRNFLAFFRNSRCFF